MSDLHRKCPCGSGNKARWCCEKQPQTGSKAGNTTGLDGGDTIQIPAELLEYTPANPNEDDLTTITGLASILINKMFPGSIKLKHTFKTHLREKFAHGKVLVREDIDIRKELMVAFYQVCTHKLPRLTSSHISEAAKHCFDKAQFVFLLMRELEPEMLNALIECGFVQTGR